MRRVLRMCFFALVCFYPSARATEPRFGFFNDGYPIPPADKIKLAGLAKKIHDDFSVSIAVYLFASPDQRSKFYPHLDKTWLEPRQIRIEIFRTPFGVRAAAGEEVFKSGLLQSDDLETIFAKYQVYLSMRNWKEGLSAVLSSIYLKLDEKSNGPKTQSDVFWWVGLFIFTLSFLGVLFLGNSISNPTPRAWRVGLCSVVGIFLGWSFLHYSLYWDPRFFLPRDNYNINFPPFLYIIRSLRYLHSIPQWTFLDQGGVWIEIFANNLILLAPHHWVGYFLGWLTPLNPNFIYKFCFLVVGNSILLTGLYFLIKELCHSREFALVSVALTGITSLTVGCLHNENLFVIFYLLPWMAFLVLRIRSNIAYLPWLATLVGWNLNNHYPQQFIVYVFFLIVTLPLLGTFSFFQNIFDQLRSFKGKAVLGFSILCFLMAVIPVLYSYFTYRDKLASAYRGQNDGIVSQDYSEYANLRGMDSMSLYPSELGIYLKGIFNPGYRLLDDRSSFLSVAVPLILLLSFVLNIPGKFFQIGLILLTAWGSIGIHGGLPKLLWPVLPGIGMLRHWAGLSGYMAFHLWIFVLLGLYSLLSHSFNPMQKRFSLLVACLLSVFCLFDIIPWWIGVPPAVLLLLRGMVGEGPRAFKSVSLLNLSWVILGSLYWANQTLALYNLWSIPDVSYVGDLSKDAYAKSLFLEGTGIRGMVSPKGLEVKEVKNLFSVSGLFWKNVDGVLTPLSKENLNVSYTNGNFEIGWKDRPFEADALLLLQYEDGRWKIPYPYKGNSLGMEVVVPKDVRSFQISREPSPWHWLIFLVFISVSLSVGILHYSNRVSLHGEAI